MVAYFRQQNALWISGGAFAGLAVGLLTYGKLQAGYGDIFFASLMIFAGVVAGRILSSVWANYKLSRITAVLYRECKPEEFMDIFSPVVQRTPRGTAEYIDGRNKLAYACEAMGDFRRGLEFLEGLEESAKPHLHALSCQALTINQRLKLQLLMEDQEGAKESKKQLEDLRETAQRRVPLLASNLTQCLRLAEIWLAVWQGTPADEEYLAAEILLAKNRIHKSEMQLLMARALLNRGDEKGARKKLEEASETGKGLYAGRKSQQLLKDKGFI